MYLIISTLIKFYAHHHILSKYKFDMGKCSLNMGKHHEYENHLDMQYI